MSKSVRTTVVVDADVYAFAKADAARRGMALSQVLRWYLRDGYLQRQQWLATLRGVGMKEE